MREIVTLEIPDAWRAKRDKWPQTRIGACLHFAIARFSGRCR